LKKGKREEGKTHLWSTVKPVTTTELGEKKIFVEQGGAEQRMVISGGTEDRQHTRGGREKEANRKNEKYGSPEVGRGDIDRGTNKTFASEAKHPQSEKKSFDASDGKT